MSETPVSLPPVESSRVKDYLELWLARLDQLPVSYTSHQVSRDGQHFLVDVGNYRNEIMQTDNLILFAYDEQGKLLGMRSSRYEEKPGHPDTLQASGNIEVFQRGKGVASAIEAVHAHQLQHILETHPTAANLEYVIDDENAQRLERSQMESAKKDESAEQLHQHRQKERSNWEGLYGAKGKLGFEEIDGRLVKKFIKGTPPQPSWHVEVADSSGFDPQEAIPAAINSL